MHLIIESLNDYNGNRFPVSKGERMRVIYKSPKNMRLVNQILNNEQIDWGGATILPDGYKILYHGNDFKVAANILGEE